MKDLSLKAANEVDILAFYEWSKEELTDALVSFAKLEQRYLSKYKDLKKNGRELDRKNFSSSKSKQ